mmetsp:Transcript_30192/g.43133  ORF Transcript_30192/g.43133 Transcript_30192/m.43133 type:complete len:415 (+) Transcript_30192:36-1280(+)
MMIALHISTIKNLTSSYGQEINSLDMVCTEEQSTFGKKKVYRRLGISVRGTNDNCPTTKYEKMGWVVSADVDNCIICDIEFGWMFRKHHCRACGHVVCDTCSSQKALISEIELVGPLRVCSLCYWGQDVVLHAKSDTVDSPQKAEIMKTNNYDTPSTSSEREGANYLQLSVNTTKEIPSSLFHNDNCRTFHVIPIPGYVIKTTRMKPSQSKFLPRRSIVSSNEVYINVMHHKNATSSKSPSSIPFVFIHPKVDQVLQEKKSKQTIALYNVLVNSAYFPEMQSTRSSHTLRIKEDPAIKHIISSISDHFGDDLNVTYFHLSKKIKCCIGVNSPANTAMTFIPYEHKKAQKVVESSSAKSSRAFTVVLPTAMDHTEWDSSLSSGSSHGLQDEGIVFEDDDLSDITMSAGDFSRSFE